MGSRILLWWLLYCGAVGAIRIEDFYPHGPSVDNTLPKDDDVSSPEIFLNTPIRFFGELQNSLFVNNNGILSFLIDIPIFFNVQFPLEYPVIAPLYTNVDTRKSGNVYYRETQNPDLLNKASYNVRRLYPNLAAQFSAKSLFIATWVDVGYYKEGSDKVNTYQVAISSDGEESFVELLYKDGGIQWLQGSGSGVGLPDARAQTGFVSPDGRLYSLKGSGTDQIKNVEKWTNSDAPGLFTFRIGQIGPNDNVEQPQTTESTDLDSLEHNSCMSSSTVCHSQAQCIDNESGFCCVCNEGYYGNGRTCLKDGIPLRVNGKISLDINGVKGKADLQAYIVTTDSRSYVALSKVPGELGSTLQLLVLFPNVIGWLFAKPVSGAKNGYQLTGGLFNHSLTIKYRHSAHSININQRFLGLDVFDQLKIEADISGEIPSLPEVNLSMPDYIQQFTRISPGALRSQSSHTIKVESTGQEYEMKTDQTIYFHEHCPLESLVLKLKTARNFISYEGTEKILRFASTAKVSKISEKDDPCLEGQVTCVANSSCLAEGDTFRCVCNPGFHTQYSNQGTDDYGCVDTNECELGTSTCAENAICINQVGSFSCQCMPGFSGNGHYCTEILAETPCQRNPALCNQPNSYCQIPGNLSTCDCNYGFQRYPLDEGFTCIDIDECQNPQACHVDAICQNTEGSFRCTCNPGYYGDGRDCRFIEEDRQPCQAVACGVNAECIEDPYEGAKCVCLPGYTGDGASYCNPEPKTVQGCNNCARDAFCQNNVCVCRQGFVGDGTYCSQGSQTTLKTCLNDTCWCPPGYVSQDNPPLCILNNNLPPDTYFSTTVTPYDDEYLEYFGELPEKVCLFDNYMCFCPTGYSLVMNQCLPNPSDNKNFNYETKGQSGSNLSCNILNRCHQNAQCVKISSQEYKCECNAGYEGDGYDCSDVEVNCAEIDICDPHAYCDFNPGTSRGICRCEDGYKGDGILCHKEIGCSSNTDCGSDSVCSFNPELDINECSCMPGFSRFNGICYKEDDGSITSGCHICHTDAECIENDVYGTAQCKCRSGFEGDGVTRCDYVTTCNELNNCSPTADCVYNHTYSTYQCQCRPGYEGDGLVCHPVENCQNNPSLCHPNAYCVQISHNEFNCQCKPGFVGNGQKCREEYRPTNVDEFLLVNQGMATLKIPYRPTSTNPGQPIQLKTEQIAIGLTTDCVEGRVYWSDIVSQAIRSSTYNGLDVEDVSTEDIGSPEGLTIDWINRNIYWTDSTKDTINVANLDTKEKKVIVSQGLVNPRGIAVHPGRRKIFWSDWNRASPKLEVSQFDGSNRAVFVQGPAVQLPNSLAIDWQTDELCWADAGTKSIECIGITSLIRRTVVTNCSYPFGLTITSDKYYWTDWNTQKIESAWKSGGEKSQSLDVPLGGSGKLYGIAAVSSSCPYS